MHVGGERLTSIERGLVVFVGIGADDRPEDGERLAAKIAGKSARAVQLAKWSLNGIEVLDVKQSYRFEQGFTFELYTSPDSQEARDAFAEKREARFDKEPER